MAEKGSGTEKNKADTLQTPPPKSSQAFNATPPSRSDAKNIVEQRKKAQQAKARVVATPPAATKKKPPAKKGVVTPPTKKTPVKKIVTPSKKQTPTKKGITPSKKKTPTKKSVTKIKAKAHPPVRKPSTTKKKPKKKTVKKRRKKSSTKIQIPLSTFIIAVVVLALVIGSLLAWQIMGVRIPPLGHQRATTSITVEPGMTARKIAQLLEKEGVVDSAKDFERYVEKDEIATKLQPGTHAFEPNLSHVEIGEILLANGSSAESTIMVYAGYTIDEIDAVLANKKLLKAGEFKKAAAQVIKDRGLPFAEGWFLSGSYPIEANAYTLAVAMQDALNAVIRPHLVRLEDLDITITQMVIVASMIQRETNVVDQMPLIAGVIYNRLKANMPLGIDATTRYGLDAWGRELTAKDLNSDNPYNTRRTVGLPPTGIGAPSPSALEAALNPAVHNYFYYVHDLSGEIHLATTYVEHKENIAKHL